MQNKDIRTQTEHLWCLNHENQKLWSNILLCWNLYGCRGLVWGHIKSRIPLDLEVCCRVNVSPVTIHVAQYSSTFRAQQASTILISSLGLHAGGAFLFFIGALLLLMRQSRGRCRVSSLHLPTLQRNLDNLYHFITASADFSQCKSFLENGWPSIWRRERISLLYVLQLAIQFQS